jgi:hypothetical protein
LIYIDKPSKYHTMATQIGDVRAVQPVVESSIWDSVLSFGIVIIVLAIVVFLIIFVIRWLLNKKLRTKDLFQEDYKRTLDLCRLQRNPRYLQPIMGMPLWLMSKGVSVVIRHPPMDYSNQKTPVQTIGDTVDIFRHRQGGTYRLGTYAGSCTTTDGCFNIMVKSAHQKVMGIFPRVIVIKLRYKHIQKTLNPDDKDKTRKIDIPPDSFSLSEDIILIDSVGLEKIGEYHYAVNRDNNGYIVDTKPYVYQDMIEISTQKQVIDFGRNLATVAEDWVRGNPLVQFVRKTDTGLTQE